MNAKGDGLGLGDPDGRHLTGAPSTAAGASLDDPAPSETDHELVALAEELRDFAESVCSLVEDGPAPHGLRPEDWEDAKREARRQVERALRAVNNLRDETGAPYRDARMLLTETILAHGQALRVYRAGEGPSAHSPEGERTMLQVGAAQALSFVAVHYPALRPEMSERARAEATIRAIDGVARSPNRVPWQVIAATWAGIDARDPDSERWRKDWNEHGARRSQ